jgi:spermidine synthase
MFTSALLLFMVQPMFAKMALPLLGGSPAVWNTAMVFYQAMLLGGYVYAHAATKWLGVRRQAALHMLVLMLPLLALPIGIPAGWSPPTLSNPTLWLLALLFAAVGSPFFVVSASSPMLQTWFASTRHQAAADPYFLYAASNIGSMLALLIYPTLIEPRLGLTQQSRIWASGYVVLALLTALCAVMLWRMPSRPPADPPAQPLGGERPTTGRRLRWVVLAFVPSSLMLSVTTYLSSNIAPIPLLWVIPLGIYLLTFILAFMRQPPLLHLLMRRAMPMGVLVLLIALVAQATGPIGLLIIIHLAAFFVIAMVCHGAIPRDRPPPTYLTEFFLWISVGGVLGGLFNALVAPLLFTTVLEYPLVLVLACLVQPGEATAPLGRRARWQDVALPAGLGLLAAMLIWLAPSVGLAAGPARLGLMFGAPSLICFSFSRRPLRFGLGVAAILAASALYTSDQGLVLHAERSFFGLHRVLLDRGGQFHILAHGGTRHGMQSLAASERDQPLTYYYPNGPIGQLFATQMRAQPGARVAVIGLGAGSLACYKQPGQQWTFYEIDPSVVRIARTPEYFSYLSDCAPNVGLVIGDARLSLADAPDQHYNLIVLDAYSSDSIPVHLITREALGLYRAKLAPGGVLAFHISNIYLDLKPVLANLAADAGLSALERDDLAPSASDLARGKSASQWALMARSANDFGALASDPRWHQLAPQPGRAVWTDDFSSLLTVFRWR